MSRNGSPSVSSSPAAGAVRMTCPGRGSTSLRSCCTVTSHPFPVIWFRATGSSTPTRSGTAYTGVRNNCHASTPRPTRATTTTSGSRSLHGTCRWRGDAGSGPHVPGPPSGDRGRLGAGRSIDASDPPMMTRSSVRSTEGIAPNGSNSGVSAVVTAPAGSRLDADVVVVDVDGHDRQSSSADPSQSSTVESSSSDALSGSSSGIRSSSAGTST